MALKLVGRRLCLGCALSALLLLPSVRAGETDQKLAVVNVSAVFARYDKVPDVERGIDGKFQKDKKDLQQRADDLVKRNKELTELYDSSRGQAEEAVFDRVQKLRREQFYYERDLARLNAEIQKDYTRQMREVLSDIRVAVRMIAEKGGFDIVLRSPDTDDPEAAAPPGQDKKEFASLLAPKTVAQVVERFNRNPVLFGAKTVDITEDVLKKLNEDYTKRTGVVKKP
jgi:Skp family chaperone for outer membrane proteins